MKWIDEYLRYYTTGELDAAITGQPFFALPYSAWERMFHPDPLRLSLGVCC